jgi:CRP/FNR family cyclic AMP-dependent transcriptional regulator
MEIVRCDFASEAAQAAFRLRYQVYGPELGIDDSDIDHAKGVYIDALDKHCRIYVAMKDGEAIATVRALYDRDYDFAGGLPENIRNMLGIENFLRYDPGALAIATKFAISPNHRGSLAANLVTSKMFRDFLDDGINFVFSWCAPYLFDFYSQLGFHMYSRSINDKNGLWTPIVLPTQDWPHLQNIKSPLCKHIDKAKMSEPVHASVKWFRDNYSESLEKFVSSYDDRVLEKIFSFSGGGEFGSSYQDVNIFNSMSADDIRKIIGSGKILRFSAGQVVIQTGNKNNEMFIVLDGEIRVSVGRSDMLPYSVGPGQVFGEISMLSRTSRTADCVASKDTEVAIISRQNLLRLIKIEPEISTQLLLNLARSLSLKLKRTNEYITSSKKLSYWPSLILEIRTNLNLSQEAFAELVCGDPDAVNGWELGADTPPYYQQKKIEEIASDKNITSLGGVLELVRSSMSRMFIVDEDEFVIASSKSSEWTEGATVLDQLSVNANCHFTQVSKSLHEAGFWKGRGGAVIECDYNDNGKIWHSIITSVSIRDRVYAVVEQVIV